MPSGGLLVILLCSTASLLAQAEPSGGCHDAPPVGWAPRELLERPITLREGVGRVGEPVSTSSKKAQSFYDQGLAYLHSYVSEREKARIELRRLQIAALRDLKSLEKTAAYRRKLDHYLVHSYEHAGRIDDALAHGEKYAAAANAIPHAHHMYGHDLRRVGRTREAIERFEIADRLEVAYFEREKINPEMDWHHPHNLDLLATSYQHQGQMKRTEELMRRSYVIRPVTEMRAMNKKEWPGFLLARDRVDEAAAAARQMAQSSYSGARALGHVFSGQVALRRGDINQAREQLEAATAAGAKLEGVYGDFARASLQPYVDKLRGGILLRSGDREKGRELLKNAQAALRAIPGPDAWMQALFELESITRIARDADDWDLVEYTAGQMLEHDAAYGGAYYVMALVAARKGASLEASRHMATARKYWVYADADLPELQGPVMEKAATR